MSYHQYGALKTTIPLPPGISTASIKQVSEKYYGNLIRSSDSPNNTQRFHSIDIVCDTTNVPNCVPALGASDLGGFILTEYDSEPMKGELAKVHLVYSAFNDSTPGGTSTEQSSTKQLSIQEWSKGGNTFYNLLGGDGTSPLNGAIFAPDGYDTSGSIASTPGRSFGGYTPAPDPAGTGSNAYFTSNSLFQTWGKDSPYLGNDTFEVPSISYTYTDYSTSEFSSDADLFTTIQTPTGAPSLPAGGNWLLLGSNRGKSGYFYSKADTYVSNVPGWNSDIYS